MATDADIVATLVDRLRTFGFGNGGGSSSDVILSDPSDPDYGVALTPAIVDPDDADFLLIGTT